MVKVHVFFVSEAATDAKSTVIRMKSIQVDGKPETYALPTELQSLTAHAELTKCSSVSNCIKSFKKCGQQRSLMITLPASVVPLYFDEDENF